MNPLITAAVLGIGVGLAGGPVWAIVGFALTGAFIGAAWDDAHKTLNLVELMRLDVDEIRSTARAIQTDTQSIQFDVRKD